MKTAQPPHRFTDEWLTRAVRALAGVGEAFIEARRAEHRPSLAACVEESGLATPDAMSAAVESIYRVKTLRPDPRSVDRRALGLLPEKVCRARSILPWAESDGELQLLMANPLDEEAMADAHALSGRRVIPFYCPKETLESLIESVTAGDVVVFDALEGLEEALPVEVIPEFSGSSLANEELNARAPVIRLVNALITKALRMRASDIHLEQGEEASLVRFRVDGELKNILNLPRSLAAGPLATRFKVMANLDISDRMRPQDGRAKLRVGREELGLRVSTLPTQHGEKVVVRLLDRRLTDTGLDALGLDPRVIARLDALCKQGQGIVLVTGPTGSGKTTTLYALLNRLKGEGVNIVTVEDPIEYKIPGLNQVQVNEKAGLGFAQVLRSVLRQDPDVILIGEIRDRETAEIALQAALTGHLVLSTLHTNDAVSAVARLQDMGVERFKLQPALLAVTAQRLVRRLCGACSKPSNLPVPTELYVAPPAGALGPRARGGCDVCRSSGFVGRVPVVEFIEFTPAVRERLGKGDPKEALIAQAEEESAYVSMAADAGRILALGLTTLEEVAPYGSSAKQPRIEPPAVRPPAPPPSTTEKRVLIADDDSTARLLARLLLEKEGYAVTEAIDGHAAVAAVAAARPDLILLDMHMPGLDGLGVIRAIRDVMGDAKVPILILSGSSDEETQSDAFKAGADDYVVKPLRAPALRMRVAAALRRAAL